MFAVTAETDWLLFDNFADPFQINNLIDDPAYKEIKEIMRGKLNGYLRGKEELLPGLEYIKKHGNIKEFNRSQDYFRRKPVI